MLEYHQNGIPGKIGFEGLKWAEQLRNGLWYDQE
jgi:hypothetical protein